jgi:hypothetical protein
MYLNWPTDIQRNTNSIQKIEVSTLAYADDTTWVALSKDSLQKIIYISNEFFELNDIEINGMKSELIAWKPNKKTDREEGIWIGTPPKFVEVKKAHENTRFLGVWMNLKN